MHKDNKAVELLLKLIKEYIDCSKYLCKQLKEIAGDSETILRAVRTKKIPKEGYLEDNIYYCFHGIGCYFELENTEIEIDFGPDDKCDGFDLNKLKIFLQSKNKEYLYLNEDNKLEDAFNTLIKENIIYNSKLAPSEYLYYIN